MDPLRVNGNSQDGDEVAGIRDDDDVGRDPPDGHERTQRPGSGNLLYTLVHQAL